MLKALLVILTLILSVTSFAKEELSCSPDAETMEFQITNAPNCAMSVKMAQTCAVGSSIDSYIAGLAQSTCLKGLNLSQKDLDLLNRLYDRCNEAYADKDGTIYVSLNAFCRLTATEFIVALNEEN